MDLSVIIPIKDEQDNLAPLHERLNAALHPLDLDYEMVFVDDGSTDHSFALLERMAAADGRVKVVRLRRNFGQTKYRRSDGRKVQPVTAGERNRELCQSRAAHSRTNRLRWQR